MTSLGIFTTDKNFRIQTWNSIMEIFTGIPESEISGKLLFDVFPEIRERNLDKKFINVIENGQVEFLSSVFHKYLIRVKPLLPVSGAEFMLQSVSIAPLFDGSKIIGTISTIKDVTAQRIKEDSLREIDYREKIDTDEQEKLLFDMDNQDWRIRKKAVESLQKSTPDIIEEILIKIKNSHKNLNVLNSALQVLLGHTDKVIQSLHDLIKSNDKDLRIYAAQTLGEVKDPESISILIKTLDDPDQNVVYHAIESLGKLKAYEAIDKLIEIALRDDFFTSFAAIDALKNMGEKVLLLHVHKLIKRDVFHPLIIEIFRDVGDDSSIPYLIELIENSSQNIFDIAEALVKIYQRYEEYYKEGNYIILTIKRHLNDNSLKLLRDCLSNRTNPKIIFLIQLLTLIGDDDTLKNIFQFLRNNEFRKIIIQNIIKRKDDASKLLLEQLKDADFELKLEILKVIGNLYTTDVIQTLSKYLDEEDEEILITALNSLAKIGSRDTYHKIIKLLSHPSNIVRRAAISALNSIGHPEMSKDIYKLLHSENLYELDSAIRIAGYFGYSNCIERMIELCSHPDDGIRSIVIENIGIFESEKVISILERALKDDNPKIRMAAVKSLVFVPDKKVYQLLSNALKDENFWVRLNAIRAIQFLRFTDGYKSIIKLLETETNVPVIRSALVALGEIGRPESVPTIIKFIDDENSDISLTAIESLGKIRHPDAVQPLIELLHSSDSKKRLKSIEALKNLKFDSTIEIIKLFALTETQPELKKEAIDALSEFGSEAAIKTLIELTKNHNLREFAINGLSKQNVKWLYIFEKALNEESIFVRLAILEALTLMKNEEATRLITQSLDDDSPLVRIYAINSCKRLGTKEAIKKITYIAKNDNNELVKNTALEYLSTIL